LHERFEVLNARLEQAQLIALGVDNSTVRRVVSRPGHPADLADPRDQPLTLAHSSPPTRPLGLGRARWVAAALLL
jgi:hypothetical protein